MHTQCHTQDSRNEVVRARHLRQVFVDSYRLYFEEVLSDDTLMIDIIRVEWISGVNREAICVAAVRTQAPIRAVSVLASAKNNGSHIPDNPATLSENRMCSY